MTAIPDDDLVYLSNPEYGNVNESTHATEM